MDRLRHAVIGCGMVAGYGHLPTLAGSEDFQLAAVCDRNPERLKEASEKYGVPGFPDAGEMLAQVPLDSVTICTTLPTHGVLAEQVAAAGKHCFCEKPMAADRATAKRMVAAFRKAKRVLAINFETRFDPTERTIRDYIRAGRVGRLLSMRYKGNWDNHWHRPHIRPRRIAFLQESFGSLDCGIHKLDRVRWVTGAEFERVTAEGSWMETEYRYPSHIHILGRLTNGTMVSIEESFAYSVNAKDRFEASEVDIIGDRGVIHIEFPFDQPARMHCCFENETIVSEPKGGKPWATVYAEFAQVCRANSLAGSDLATGADGAAAVTLVEQIIAACERGRCDVR